MKKSLDRKSFTPLYAQIQQGLREAIDSGEVAPGSAVPSERELSEKYGVSRMTARQALRALRQDGLVYRERGVGTFVAKRKIDVHTRNLAGFTKDMRRRGLKPSSRVILLKREAASPATAEELGIEAGEQVFRSERLRLADGTPMAYESSYIPTALCPELDQYDLGRESLYRILEEEYGITMQRAEETLEAAGASRREARLLDVKTNAPLLIVRRVVYSDKDRAVESVKTIYRADRYSVTFRLAKSDP